MVAYNGALIDGEIVPMAAQNMPHKIWKARLAKWLYAHLPNDLVLVPEGALRLVEVAFSVRCSRPIGA